MQVQQLTTPCGTANAQLLLQLETDMLLGLAVHQLVATMPASFPKQHALSELACRLKCSALASLRVKANLHKLPLPAAYTGPQLAVQVMPSPLGVPPPPTPLSQGEQQQHQQQQQQSPHQQQQQPHHQQQHQQQPQCYTVAPTAQLLAELLPLLTSQCLYKVHEQQGLREELLTSLQVQLQQPDGGSQADGVQGPSQRATDVIRMVTAFTNAMSPGSLRDCVAHMYSLLSCAVVPRFNPTAAEGQAAGAGDQALGGCACFSCVLHAPEAVMQNAGDVLRV